jgi:hypothetical protein
LAAQSVHFTDKVAFGESPYGGVAGKGAYTVRVLSDEKS